MMQLFFILNSDLHLSSKIDHANIFAQLCHQISRKYNYSSIYITIALTMYAVMAISHIPRTM